MKKKITKTSELLWLFGILFVGLGVALCNKADLGVSMIAASAFVLYDALQPLIPNLTVGVAEYAFQGVLLLLLFLLIRRFRLRYFLTFAVAVIYGYVLNFFIWILGDITIESTAIRWILLFAGDICSAIGVACCFKTYMPLEVYELFVTEISTVFNRNIHRVKRIFDLSLLTFSLGLAILLFYKDGFDFSKIATASFHHIGLGTVFTTVVNSVLIQLASRLLDQIFDPTPLFPRCKAWLTR